RLGRVPVIPSPVGTLSQDLVPDERIPYRRRRPGHDPRVEPGLVRGHGAAAEPQAQITPEAAADHAGKTVLERRLRMERVHEGHDEVFLEIENGCPDEVTIEDATGIGGGGG